MKSNLILRSALFAVALGAALSAQAVVYNFSVLTKGSWVLRDSNGQLETRETTFLEQSFGGGPKFTSAQFKIGKPGVESTMTYFGPSGTLTFLLNIAGRSVTEGAESSSGTWSLLGGTGWYTQVLRTMPGVGVTGGTWAMNYRFSGPTYTNFQGTISWAPVPEPASMAALGLGAVAMLRRRKR